MIPKYGNLFKLANSNVNMNGFARCQNGKQVLHRQMRTTINVIRCVWEKWCTTPSEKVVSTDQETFFQEDPKEPKRRPKRNPRKTKKKLNKDQKETKKDQKETFFRKDQKET